jgi:pyruvate formate lyase activating enzyme
MMKSYTITKREFLKLCGAGLGGLCLPLLPGLRGTARAQRPQKGLIKTTLSPYFTALKEGAVRCDLCPRLCRVPEGKRGYCGVRENRDGKYYSLVYGNPCALHLDPIEKKPFFHVLPGTRALSIATAGCNFDCKFCQNWEISQATPEEVYSYDVSPDLVVTKAREMGARSVAYTYVEPTVFLEYMLDVGKAARGAGLMNVIHSNGFVNEKPLRDLCNVLDAAQIDLKGFSEDFYRELCNGSLAPVLRTLKTLKEEHIHVEITHLMIPTKNDDPGIVKDMCVWIKEELGSDTPLHFSRFYPLYKLTKLPPTPVSVLEKARDIALSVGLHYVYIGNVPGHEGWNTFCPECGRTVIRRTGYMIREIHLNRGRCAFCGNTVPGIWH